MIHSTETVGERGEIKEGGRRGACLGLFEREGQPHRQRLASPPSAVSGDGVWGEKRERSKLRGGGGEEMSGEREGVSWEFIYIHLWKLPLTTLSFILNYIFNPKVCIYYYIPFFLIVILSTIPNTCSWKFLTLNNYFNYISLNSKNLDLITINLHKSLSKTQIS